MRFTLYAFIALSILYAASGSLVLRDSPTANNTTCVDPSTSFHLSDPPYEDFFYSDCHSSSQVVVTSPLPGSNLTIIGPRLLVAWPAGNSGIVAYFQPQNGVNGTLGISLQNNTGGSALSPIYTQHAAGNPVVGVSGTLSLNNSASLTVAILGSIRTIRDFTEGPSILQPTIQNATVFSVAGSTASVSRLWLDNVTTTTLTFGATLTNNTISLNNRTLNFPAGTYQFNASFNYSQLDQLNTTEVLNTQSAGLVTQNPDQAQSLSFLSYSDKLLAGAWRFLTYFGRDSMISLLLMEPILSPGEGGAIEAVLSAVLERINRTDGSVAHEETIGDYATFLNLQDNITSTAPGYDYKMIDSDYYLPIAMADYALRNPVGQTRAAAFLNKTATVNPNNAGLTYHQLLLLTAEKLINATAPFAAHGGQVKENLIHLKEGQIVGEWRDSTYGIGGGRVPYDVNTALAPAALRAIADLAAAGWFPSHPTWARDAARAAGVWEDRTLAFFEVSVPPAEARALLDAYVANNSLPFPSRSELVDNTTGVAFHALALDGNNNQTAVRVMNTDDCFRLFLLNATANQTQLSAFLAQAADHVLQPFPLGLATDVGLVVANPAFGGDPVYAANWTNNAYHGTVVWSWQLAMTAAGFERQLARCLNSSSESSSTPDFCADAPLRQKVAAAYGRLWDLIEANAASLGSEVWSWTWDGAAGKFVTTPLGALPPPPGQSPTESDVRQLWSLTFLAVKRNADLA